MAETYDSVNLYDQEDLTYNGTAVTSISINGIHGHSFVDGTEDLIVVWNNHPVIYNSSTTAWEFQSVTLATDTDVYFESFLDHVFMVNYSENNYSYNGTAWSTTTNVTGSPIAQFVKEHKTRLYLYKVYLGGTAYPSFCWYSDFPKKGVLKWGLETNSDLVQSASSAVITSSGATFITKNIKVGDPIWILDGDNSGQYTVLTVDSETQLTLTESLTSASSSNNYWVGGNYIEIATEDGDMGMGMAETSNELFLFKKNSLWRYDSVGKVLRKVKTAPGTTSSRSIVESGGYIYWYHPSGIYRTQGSEEQLISNTIEDAIEGVSSSFQSEVCGWRNEIDKTVNMYLGTVTLRDGRMITHAVACFNESSETMSIRSLKTRIKVATNWLESNVPKVYAGDTTRTVYQLESGYDFNGSAIPFELETKPIYPVGSSEPVNFSKIEAFVDNGPDIIILYKLLYREKVDGKSFVNDQDWTPLRGDQLGDMSTWYFPTNSVATGVKLKVIETSTNESFLLEKLVIYYNDV